jgi:hypothetical protein
VNYHGRAKAQLFLKKNNHGLKVVIIRCVLKWTLVPNHNLNYTTSIETAHESF